MIQVSTIARGVAVVVMVGTFTAVSFPLRVGATDSSTPIAVDRQAYTATTPVDPCRESTTSICVGATGQMLTMLAFIHLDLSRLPRGSFLTSARVTLVPDDEVATNLNTGSATLRACVLVVELAPELDSDDPPPYDCDLAQATANQDGAGTWSVELAPLASVWNEIGNTGAALVPDFTSGDSSPDPGVSLPEAWSVSFDKSATKAAGLYTASAKAVGVQAGPQSTLPVPAPIPPSTERFSPPDGPAVERPTGAAAIAEAAPAAPPSASVLSAASPEGRSSIVVRKAWLLAFLALLAGSAGLWLGDASRQLRAQSHAVTLSTLGAAMSTARSRRAAALAVLLLAALISLGSIGGA